MEVMIPFYICNMHGNVCADVAQGERGWLGCSTVREGVAGVQHHERGWLGCSTVREGGWGAAPGEWVPCDKCELHYRGSRGREGC